MLNVSTSFVIAGFSKLMIDYGRNLNIGSSPPKMLFLQCRTFASSTKKNTLKTQLSKGKKRIDPAKNLNKQKKNPLSRYPPGTDMNSFITTRSNIEAVHLSKSIDVNKALRHTSSSADGLPYSIINEFSSLCNSDGIKISAFKQRNRYIKPCHQRRALMYATRKEKYNSSFGERVSEIIKNYGHEIQI